MINFFLAITIITGQCLAGKFDGLDISGPKKRISAAFSKFSELTEMVEKKKEERTHILVFGATWCGPCVNIKGQQQWAEQSGWKFGKDAHIEFVDIDIDPERFAAYNTGTNSVPLVVDDQTKEKLTPNSMLDVLNFYTSQRKKRE
jgi:thiol-disulfide isomerase/thioredoxin